MNSLGYGRPVPDTEELFFINTYHRLVTNMVAIAILAAPAIWIWYGQSVAWVFLLGCAIGILNFYWLRRSIEAMGSRLDNTGRRPSRAGVLLRFLLRYALVAVAAYVILKSTAGSLNGLFAGLSIPVSAILIEAIYQVVGAFRTQTLNPRN